MADELEEKLKTIFSNILNIPLKLIDSQLKLKINSNWSSIAHLNLLFSIEDEFKISFTDDEVVKLMDYPSILRAISEKCSNTRDRSK